jgi:hypothetical protein
VNEIRERRAGENENLFRRVNERVEELSRGLDDLSLVCECSRVDCVERLSAVSIPEYEEVRRHPQRFFVAAGHERPDVETVVEERHGYLIVEKRGAAGEAAHDGDPRPA